MLELKNKEKRVFFDRLLGIVIEPDATFKDVVSKPDLLLPFLIVLLISLAAVPVSMAALEQISHTLPENVDPGAIANIGPAILIVQVILGLLLAMLFRAVVYLIVGAIMASKVSFKTSFVIAGYLNFPILISNLISFVTFKLNGTVANFTLSFILPPEQYTSKLGVFLANINPFTIWFLVLSTFALSHLWSTSRKKSFVITLVMWLLVVGINVIFAG